MLLVFVKFSSGFLTDDLSVVYYRKTWLDCSLTLMVFKLYLTLSVAFLFYFCSYSWGCCVLGLRL